MRSHTKNIEKNTNQGHSNDTQLIADSKKIGRPRVLSRKEHAKYFSTLSEKRVLDNSPENDMLSHSKNQTPKNYEAEDELSSDSFMTTRKSSKYP